MVSNGRGKHRSLEELYRATWKIAKPKVTPVLQGIYRIQGPEDELELTTGTSKEAPPVGKITPYEDIHSRTELGIPGACVAPCSSCTGSPYPIASDVELKTEDEMSDEIGDRKVGKQGSSDDAELHLLRSSMSDDQPQTSGTSNFISACSSRDSFSENVDGKGTRRMCDTSSAYLCDGSKLLTSEEQVDDNHAGGCSKSGLHNELHTVCELVNGCRNDDDSSCYAAKMETHSTSTPDPGHKRNNTYESLGDSHKQATSRSLRQLLRVDSVKTSKDTQTLTKVLCRGTSGKDQFLSNTVSDNTSAQSNVTSHTLTGTASSKCPEEVLNSDENLSHLSEAGEMKTLPCDHHVESRLSGTSNSKDGVAVEKRTTSSMVSTSVLSKSSSDGSDGMDLLCSSTNSSHVELLEVSISRKRESDTSLSGYFLNKTLSRGHMETGSKSLPIEEPDMENSSGKKSIFQLRSSDAVIPSVCKELEEISKLDKKEPTVFSLELQGIAINPNETEHGKAPSPTSIAVADPEQKGFAFPSSQTAEKPLAASAQCSKHTNLVDASERQEPQSESEHTEPDPDETDVKVCDICGDAGREERLAVCSRCNDGAEHIYCMKIMLEKVPEGEWICEECKSRENESQKSDNSESSLPTSKVSCTSEKNKFPKSISVPECPSKLAPRLSDVQARKATVFLSPPSISAKRHADGSEISIAIKKQAIEAVSNGSPRSSSVSRKTLFLREGSFKNLDVNKVRPVKQLPLASGKSSNNSEEVHLSSTSSSNSRMQSRLQSPRAKFASHDKGVQFSNSGKVLPYGSSDLASKAALASKGTEGLSKVFSPQGMKPKPKPNPKVKQILEEVPRKQPASSDSRKEGLIRTVSKSASFKSITSLSNLNGDNLKSESQNLLSARDSKSLKQFKEGSSLLVRQNSHNLDPSNSSIPAVCTGSSVPMSGMMVPESDAKTRLSIDVSLAPKKDIDQNTASEIGSRKLLSSNHGDNAAPTSNQSDKRAGLVEEKSKLNSVAFDTSLQGLKNTITSAGNSDLRKLSTGYETPTASIQQQVQTPSVLDGTSSMTNPVEHKVMEQNCHQPCLVEDGPAGLIIPDKSCSIPLHALQPRDSSNLEARVKEPSSFGRSRTFSANTRKIRCFKCSELGHIAQFCPNRGIDAGVSTRTPVDISDTRDSTELTGKSKWNHTIENVLPHKAGNHENDRLIICSDDASLPTNAGNNELAPGSLPLTTGVASDTNLTTGSVSESYSSLGKTVDVEGLMKRSATNDGNELELFSKDQPSLPSTSSITSSAIPVHDFTWQGSFEVQRSGELSDICDGVQAHLSTCASPKVLEVAKKFPPKVQLEEISRSSSWPVQFQVKCPTEDNVALYFFAKDALSYERNYKKLLQNMLRNDLALKANFNGVELLIFTSKQLPDKSQRNVLSTIGSIVALLRFMSANTSEETSFVSGWNRLLFLWGVFLERKVGCADAVTGSLKKAVTNVESSCQGFSSTMTSGTSASTLPLHVQVDKDSPSSGEGLGTVKATASEILSSSAPLQSGHKNVNIQRNMPTGSHKSNQSVSDAVVPVGAECPDATLDINPQTNTFQTDGQTLAKLLSRSPQSSGGGHDRLRSDDTSVDEVYIDAGSLKEMKLPDVRESETPNFPSSGSSLPTVSNRKEASSDFPKDAKLTICNQDQKKLTEEKQGEGSKSSSNSAEACDSSQKRNRPMLIESGGAAKHELLAIKGETHSLDLRPWCRRRDSHSSQKPFLVNETKGEASEEQEFKRLKMDNGLNVGDHSTCATSALYDLNSSFSDYETKLDCSFDDRQAVELSRTAERSFFSVDFGHARDCKASSSTSCAGFSSSGDGSGQDMPDLELALGAGRKKPKRGLLPLFCHVFDKSSENNAGARKDNAGHASDDDAASSLSLSLASPIPVKERTQKAGSTLEKLLPGRSHVNTSLLLFGGCTDS